MRTSKRKRFNRFVKNLAGIYNMPYYEVEKIYHNQNMDIQSTRLILNLKSC
jgi:hypothetical protein